MLHYQEQWLDVQVNKATQYVGLRFKASMYISAASLINPRRACAARVTVVVLSVRLSVHILFSDYRLRDGL